MKPLHAVVCAGVWIALVLGVPNPCLSQSIPAGVLTENAPVFLYPDTNRTPLATLPKGTTVRLLQRQGDWYRVEFRDPRFGNRTGYIRAEAIQVQPSAKPTIPGPPGAGPARQGPPSGAARRPAQRPRMRIPREPVTISLNGGLQTTSRGFLATSTFERNAESGTLSSTYSGDRPVVFDVAARAGVWRSLTVGVAGTQASKPLGAEVTAEIPHPFFFDRPRTVTGESPDLQRDEVALHMDAGWTAPAGPSMRVTIFAGPSYFRVTQALVTDLRVDEAYPFDVASFAGATTIEATQSKWGFNVGFDVTQRLSRYFGVGVIGRYSQAKFTFPIVDTHEVDIEAGGFQIGGGVRLQF